MSLLANRIKTFLNKFNTGEATLSREIINDFGKDCSHALSDRVREREQREFKLVFSNIGKPLCQLQMEKAKAPSEPLPYSFAMKMMYGDMIEALVIAVMRGAGVNIQSRQEKVELDINGTVLSGRYDVEIDNALYDIKSASSYSFSSKFSQGAGGFLGVLKDDHFGYVAQGYGYSQAAEKPFGGWIVVDKSTGDIEVVEPPSFDEVYRENALTKMRITVDAIKNNEPFKRCFTDVAETYQKVETGNRHLQSPCTFCPFKKTCWPEVQYKPAQIGKAKEPVWKWYTEIKSRGGIY